MQSDAQALDRCVQTSSLTLTSPTQGPNIPKSSLWSCKKQECPQRGPSSRHTCKTDPVVDQGRLQSKSSFSQKHGTFTMSHYYMLPDLLSLKASGGAKRLHRQDPTFNSCTLFHPQHGPPHDPLKLSPTWYPNIIPYITNTIRSIL